MIESLFGDGGSVVGSAKEGEGREGRRGEEREADRSGAVEAAVVMVIDVGRLGT